MEKNNYFKLRPEIRDYLAELRDLDFSAALADISIQLKENQWLASRFPDKDYSETCAILKISQKIILQEMVVNDREGADENEIHA